MWKFVPSGREVKVEGDEFKQAAGRNKEKSDSFRLAGMWINSVAAKKISSIEKVLREEGRSDRKLKQEKL